MNALTKKLLSWGVASAVAVAAGYLVAPLEGKSNKAYLDMVGVPTLCYGQTKGVKLGDYKTDEECEKDLAEDLVKYNSAMKKNLKVPLKDYEEVAYTSFIWNIGETKWNSSTLLKKLNSGDYSGACKEILRWNKATFSPSDAEKQRKAGETCTAKSDGKFSCTVKGLTNRRITEYNVCTNQNSEVSDALEALKTAQQAPVNVEEGEHEVVVEKTPVQPPVCRWKFFGICFRK